AVDGRRGHGRGAIGKGVVTEGQGDRGGVGADRVAGDVLDGHDERGQRSAGGPAARLLEGGELGGRGRMNGGVVGPDAGGGGGGGRRAPAGRDGRRGAHAGQPGDGVGDRRQDRRAGADAGRAVIDQRERPLEVSRRRFLGREDQVEPVAGVDGPRRRGVVG